MILDIIGVRHDTRLESLTITLGRLQINKAENPITVGLIISKEERGGRREEGGFITTSARNVFVNIVQIFKSNIIVTF